MAATQTAAMRRIRRLYHYQRFRPDWLRNTMVDNLVHCPSPKDFNDPWDCRPYFSDTILDDPDEREQFIRYLDRADRKRYPNKPEEIRLADLHELRTNRSKLREILEQLSGIDSAIHGQYRVYCLTTHPDSILMWSHYADNHRGICLEYATDNECFSGALGVIYCSEYPLLKYGDTNPSTILLPLLIKSEAWTYEDEYRLIAEDESSAHSPETLHTRNNMLTIPTAALKSVIVGCATPHEDRAQIQGIIKDSGRAIMLKHATRIPNEYRLSLTYNVAATAGTFWTCLLC